MFTFKINDYIGDTDWLRHILGPDLKKMANFLQASFLA